MVMVNVVYCNKEYFSQYQIMERWQTAVTYKNKIWSMYLQYKSKCFLHWCGTVNVTAILDTVNQCVLQTAHQKLSLFPIQDQD
jgi:hypothetical protein